jgi:hypothetical protein
MKIRKCPKCDDLMYISEFRCSSCDTSIRGEFEVEKSESMFDRLNDEDKYFVLVFLQTGGRIQDVERVMGISYPTVKAKLEEVQAKLKGENGDSHDRDENEDVAFRAEIKAMKRELKNKIRSQVREHLRGALRQEFHHGSHFHGHGDPHKGGNIDINMNMEDEETTRDAHRERKAQAEKSRANRTSNVNEILEKLEKGEIDHATAMKMINDLK